MPLLSVGMLSVAIKSIMPNVVRLSVVILNNVAPSFLTEKASTQTFLEVVKGFMSLK
jgi:hypothetical protein